jgi:hypothetical protein
MTPRLTLSIADLRAASACGLDKRITDLRAVLPDVGNDDPVDARVWWGLPSTSTADAIWSLRAAHPPERAAAVAVLVARCAAVRADGYGSRKSRAALDRVGSAAVSFAGAGWAAAEAATAAAAYAADAADAAYADAYADAERAAQANAAERAAQRADLIAALEAAPPSDQEREN